MFHMRLADAIRSRAFRALFGRRFGAFGRGSRIVRAVAIEGPENIHLGDGVYVAAQSCLAAPRPAEGSCRLVIGDGSQIGRFNHIYATSSVELGRKVLTANGVYISDNLHGYRDPETPVADQPLVQLGPTVIGEGSWIGHNACVIGVRVGKHCVIGASAVVLRDLPDYSVAVGAPARVVRRYDVEAKAWRATLEDGSFVPLDGA
jgi:acetyltransferase-like isoleucine patch superfamily enzyme